LLEVFIHATRRTLLEITVFVAGLSALGCGSATTPAPTGPTVDPCAATEATVDGYGKTPCTSDTDCGDRDVCGGACVGDMASPGHGYCFATTAIGACQAKQPCTGVTNTCCAQAVLVDPIDEDCTGCTEATLCLEPGQFSGGCE
jgi:hypothetical protein